jgi:hypothetical protein
VNNHDPALQVSIVCDCGHAGFECLTESGYMDVHEHYYLEGFEGGEVTIDRGWPSVPNILSALAPTVS